MRVATITFHCSYNFGSVLQAFALQKAIEILGHDTTIIDYRSRNFEQYRLFRLGRPRSMARRLVDFRSNLARKKSFEKFWRDYLKMTPVTYSYRDEERMVELNDQFDCFVCGSDQIWNLDCTGGVVGPFFLSFVKGKRKASYAPSLAHMSFRPENDDRDGLRRALSSFDYISIREGSTLCQIEGLVDKPVAVASDPTVLLEKDDYAPLISSSGAVQEPYLFVYLLRRCPELLESARLLSKSYGLRVLYCAEKDLDLPNSENLKGIGPDAFLSLVAGAEAVLSNSFHASVFSTILEVPFRTFACDGSASRMTDYLGSLELGGQVATVVDTSFPRVTDWSRARERRAQLREESMGMLREAIEGVSPSRRKEDRR